MKRKDEYQALLRELEQTPEALENTVQRAVKRRSALRKKRRLLGIPAGSLAACFLGFVLLVNLFPPFARACGSVPLLRELAKAVAWSPSLSAAVENEYVQPIGQSRTVNGITATVEYVIVDQKQLHVFFTLDGPYENLSAEMPEFSPAQECSIIGADFRQAPGTMLEFTLDYLDQDVPDELAMTFAVTTWQEALTDLPPEAEPSYEDEMLERAEEEQPDILAEFTFRLRFDPAFTAQGEIVPVNQSFQMDGQTLTITEAEVYPTHVRINVQGAGENTAWLKELSFYLENESGQRFEPISNGISATGDSESPAMLSYRLESPYFARSKHLTLHITGAAWLDRDKERVRVDLAHETAEFLPEGVLLEKAERRPGGWILHFLVEQQKENHFFQVWSMTYFDEAGEEHSMDSRSSTTRDDGWFEEMLPLSGYQGDVVYLEPLYSRRSVDLVPIAIPIE